jgi:broad specificity phosphatase PhoE
MEETVHFILRHGDTEANDANVFRSMLDPDLNKEGVLQAHAAAEFLKKKDIQRIVCSPLLRAFHTAQIISGMIGGRCIQQCRCLFPWQIPALMGKDRDEHKDVLDYLINHPEVEPQYGESLDDFSDRVFDFFSDKLCCPVPTLFVTHTSNIVTLRGLIEQRSPTPEAEEIVRPGGICEIRSDDEDGYTLIPVFGKSTDPSPGS